MLAIRHWWANDSDESGVTQVELLIAAEAARYTMEGLVDAILAAAPSRGP